MSWSPAAPVRSSPGLGGGRELGRRTGRRLLGRDRRCASRLGRPLLAVVAPGGREQVADAVFDSAGQHGDVGRRRVVAGNPECDVPQARAALRGRPAAEARPRSPPRARRVRSLMARPVRRGHLSRGAATVLGTSRRSRDKDRCQRRRRSCSGAPLRSAPIGPGRALRQANTPKAGNRGPAAVSPPAPSAGGVAGPRRALAEPSALRGSGGRNSGRQPKPAGRG